jgi:flagellar protein FlaG
MKIENIITLPADPVRVGSTGVESEAIAQTSTSRNSENTKPRKTLQKENRSADEVRKDLDIINTQLQNMNRSIQFSIDESSHDIVVRVVDKESGKLIRQLPPESLLRLREHMAEISGLIIEEEA